MVGGRARSERDVGDEELALTLLDRGVIVQPGYFFDFAARASSSSLFSRPEATFREGMWRILEECRNETWSTSSGSSTRRSRSSTMARSAPRRASCSRSRARSARGWSASRCASSSASSSRSSTRHAPRLAALLGADTDRIAFVPNATAGVNAVLRSLDLDRNDELLVTDQEYNACRNTLELVAAVRGARVVVAESPFPLKSPEDVIGAMLEKVTDRTRLLLHRSRREPDGGNRCPSSGSSPEMALRGIDTLVDGATPPDCSRSTSAPSARPTTPATSTSGSAHRRARRSCGSPENRRAGVRPLSISHGANAARRIAGGFTSSSTGPARSIPPLALGPSAIEFYRARARRMA